MWCDQVVRCRQAQTPDLAGMYAMVGEMDAISAIRYLTKCRKRAETVMVCVAELAEKMRMPG